MKKTYISPFVEVIESEPEVLLAGSQSATGDWGNQKGYGTIGGEEPDEKEKPIWPVEGDDWSTL